MQFSYVAILAFTSAVIAAPVPNGASASTQGGGLGLGAGAGLG